MRSQSQMLLEISNKVSGIATEIPNIKDRLEEHGELISEIRNTVVDEKGKTQHNFDMISTHIDFHKLMESKKHQAVKRKVERKRIQLTIVGLVVASISAIGGIWLIFF